MPVFDIEDEAGRKISIEGDSPPDANDVEEIFRSVHGDSTPEQPPLGWQKAAFIPRIVNPQNPREGFDVGPDPSLREVAMSPLSFAGDVVRGAAADVAAGVSGNTQFAGNIPSVLGGNQLPIDTMLADVSREAPVAATVGKISQGVAASLPLIAIMPQGALGKLVAAGFTADMLNHAGPDATALGEEMGKPPEERDYDKITSAVSSLVQTAAFAPMAGVHALKTPAEAVARFGTERINPKAAVIRELASALKDEPLEGVVGGKLPMDEAARLQMGLPPRATPEMLPELQRTKELVDRAIQEANQVIQTGGPSALELLKAQGNEIQLPSQPAQEFRPGGGQTTSGNVSFNRAGESPVLEQTRQARERNPNAIVQPENQPVRQPERPGVNENGSPAEASSGNSPVEGGKVAEEAPVNPGGSEPALSPEKQAQSRANNSVKAFAEANGVTYEEGDTGKTILDKINKKIEAHKPVPIEPVKPEREPSAKQQFDQLAITFAEQNKIPYSDILATGGGVKNVGSGAKSTFSNELLNLREKVFSELGLKGKDVKNPEHVAEALTLLKDRVDKTENFKEATKNEGDSSGKIDVPVDDLQAGERLTVDGKDVTVSKVGKGFVELDGGEKFGKQRVENGETLYVEGYEPKSQDFQKPEKKEKSKIIPEKETIIAAALKDEATGEIWTDLSHPSAIAHVPNSKTRKLEGGFVTSAGRYVNRDEASKISGKTGRAQKIFGSFASEADVKRAISARDLVSPQSSIKVPRLRAGENGTGDLLQGANQPFNLAGEKATDFEKVAAAKAKAEADKAEAKRIEEKQQLELDAAKEPFSKGSRVRVGNNPQLQTILRETTDPKFPDERIFEVQNDKTGEKQEIDQKSLTPIKERSAEQKAAGKAKSQAELDAELKQAGLDPSAFANKKQKQAALDRAIGKIEELQKKIRGTGKNLQMGVPGAILDTALEIARVTLKAGKTVSEAVEEAIKHIRRNVKSFNEKEVRGLFERELGGKTATTEPPKDGTPSSPVVPPTTEATLAAISKVFEPAPKTSTPLKTKGVNIIESLRTGIASKFRPINKLAEDIAKAYGLSKPKDIAGLMEQLKGSQGKGEADIYRFDRDVSSLVKGDEKAFSEYMFARRAIDRLKQDQADITRAQAGEDVKSLNRRSVGNFTINQLEPALEAMKTKLGPEKVAKFEKAASEYQRYMDDALKLQVESGRMSQKVYDAIKNGNQFYAPFKVMKYLEETSKPEGSGKKIDTVADFTKAMTGIEDPNFKLGDMLGAARQSILLSRILADKNTAMRSVGELAQFDTQGRFIKRLAATSDVPHGMEAVNVLEGGKQVRYAVNPDVAQAINLYGGNAGGIISRVLGAFSVPFRAGATALNLPFQVSNLLADVPRQALVSKYGINGVQDLVRYPLDLVHSLYSSIAGDMFGKDNKLFLDFLDSGVAGTTIQEHLTPEALKFKEPTTISRSRKLASSVINLVPEFAQAIEQTSKILGVKRAMRVEGVPSGKELAKQIPEAITELRRFSGSPDFGRQGKAVEAARLNLLYMFLNARIQGTLSDVGRLTGADGGKTAAKTWFRLATAVGIPTAYLYYLNQKPGNKEDYDSRPAQEKQNYWLIPKEDEQGKPRYVTTEEGEKIRDFWRIPKRETAKWIANLTESALNFAQNRDPKAAKDFGAQMLQEISPVNIQGDTAQERMESVASSLNPVIKAPLELATGRDLYRHRDIMSDQLKKASPEQQFTDRTPEAFKKLANLIPDASPEMLRSPIILENLTRNLTAGLLTQFMSRQPVKGRTALENQPLAQRFQSLPITDISEFQKDIQGLERQAADEQLIRHRKATKVLEDNPGKTPEELISKALPDLNSRQPTHEDAKLIRQIVDLYVAKENGATFKDRQVIALPARQRALWVQQQLAGLNGDARDLKIQDLARKRIFTEAVATELATLMEESK